MSSINNELRSQWGRPSDILSLLLLIGSEIVQKSIAQVVGRKISLIGNKTTSISVAPVAFSFGWAAFAFSNLMAAVGDMKLMPSSDFPSILVNCENGFNREVKSWVLGRLLRDHEIRCNVDARSRQKSGQAVSMRIDIFQLGPVSKPKSDFVWWLGWATLLAQVAIATIPWIFFNDWGIIGVTICGNLLVAVTVAMPQWAQEKWPARILQRDKVTCLTRGNGHRHIMVLIAAQGSWDLEDFATGVSLQQPETRWISLALAVAWICLLISTSGFRENTWFLIAIGGIGMFQNIFAAGAPRDPAAFNFHLTTFSRAPTIIGRPAPYADDIDAEVNLSETLEELDDIAEWGSDKLSTSPQGNHTASMTAVPMPRWLNTFSKDDGVPNWLESVDSNHGNRDTEITHASSLSQPQAQRRQTVGAKNSKDYVCTVDGVHGALMELEKWVPTAGLAMVQMFFPTGLEYNDESIRDNKHKKFWQKAYYTRTIRRKAEEKRRAEARKLRNPELV